MVAQHPIVKDEKRLENDKNIPQCQKKPTTTTFAILHILVFPLLPTLKELGVD